MNRYGYEKSERVFALIKRLVDTGDLTTRNEILKLSSQLFELDAEDIYMEQIDYQEILGGYVFSMGTYDDELGYVFYIEPTEDDLELFKIKSIDYL